VEALIEGVRLGRRRDIARLITKVENRDPGSDTALRRLYPHTGKAHVVGVTGPPGSGKSTLVNAMALELRRRQMQIGIVAVDPSSPFTGGAFLGDRIRMRDLAGDQGIFIRSMASRGTLGGLARTTSDVVKVLDAAGFDMVLVETVGAGQAEVDIAATAHTTLVIEAPGMGDEVQTIKAGILEIADVLVVNKADRPGSDRTVKALRAMLRMGRDTAAVDHHGIQMDVNEAVNKSRALDAWEVPVLATVAPSGEGVELLVETVLKHGSYLRGGELWMQKERARSRQEIGRMLQERFMARLLEAVPPDQRETVVDDVARRRKDPYTAVEELFGRVQS
jgi:LAO/AO transport system kinase